MEICSTPFAALGRAQASALGYSSLPIAVVPHPFGTVSREAVREMAQQCVDEIAALACASDAATGAAARETQTSKAIAARAAQLEIAYKDDLYTAFNKLCRERRWSDGLPVVPPTSERVGKMLAHTSRAPQDIVAKLAPAFGAATV